MSLLNQPTKTTPGWDVPVNENFAMMDDKMEFKSVCTYDSDANMYTLELQNIPDRLRSALPSNLPGVFAVEAIMPNSAAYGAGFKINDAVFTPKYAGFEQWDAVQIIFSNLDRTCFLASGGGGGSGDVEDRVALLEGMLFAVDGAPFLISFDSLDGIVTQGIWNESARRIEC
jgi:hypothetical protein